MASVGPQFPAVGADNAAVGSLTWVLPGNIAADDGVDSTVNFGPSVGTIIDISFTLWNSSAIGTAKSTMAWSTTGKRVDTLGNATDLWGTGGIAVATAQGANFGFAQSCGFKGAQTHYLVATKFDFSAIPDSATIVGVECITERESNGNKFSSNAAVDFSKMTIYYTLPGRGFFAIMSGPT